MLVAACTLGVVLPVLAAAPARHATRTGQLSSNPSRATVFDQQRRVDAGRINMFNTNFGSFAWDITTGNAGLVWPKGTNQTAIFASGLWLGCLVGGETRTLVAEYSQEYGPGPIVGGTFDNPNRPEHRVYKVSRYRGDPSDTAHVERSPAELAADSLLDPLVHHAWSEYLAGAKPHGAPTRSWRLPNTSTPQPGDSVDVEGPDVLGDQMLWAVYNDADPSLHTNNAGGTAPLGVEIQQTTFAYDRADDLGDMVFLRFRILNKGANTLDSLYASLWSDPDLGGFVDDLVGCDVGRALGFCYNATDDDLQYGSTPPAVGYVLLQGLRDPNTLAPLGFTSFNKYIGGTDPGSFDETYNYMRGLLPDGSPLIDPTTGLATRYFHPGDPLTGIGWLDSNPADRRMMLSSGASRMLPGSVQEVWAAIVVGRGSDRLASVGVSRCLADRAREAFQRGFAEPPPLVDEPCSVSAPVAMNCPRPEAFWAHQCSSSGAELTAQQLAQAAAFVNGRSTLFNWPTNTLEQFCATLSPAGNLGVSARRSGVNGFTRLTGTLDARQRARREFAAFLANFSGSQTDLHEIGGARIWLNSGTDVTCPPLRASNLGELAQGVELGPSFLQGSYLNYVPDNRSPLEGVNFGLSGFGGGAGPAVDFLGASSIDPMAQPDSFTTVELRFSHTATQKAYRFLRLEKASDGGAPPQGRAYRYGGYWDVPMQAWDTLHNRQLALAFVERTLTADDGTFLPDAQQLTTRDSTWKPDASGNGGREYLWVLSRDYSGTPVVPGIGHDGAPLDASIPLMWVLTAKLRSATDVIDDGDAFRFELGRPPSPGADSLLVELEGRSLADADVRNTYEQLADCLAAVNAGIGIGRTCTDGSLVGVTTLVRAEVVGGRVRLVWRTSQLVGFASVERRVDVGDWALLARIRPDGGGTITYEDSTAVAGQTYLYRLALTSGGGVQYAGQTRVVVSGPARLAFLGSWPQPARGKLTVSFSLGSREPARLEFLDIAGRRVLARPLTGLEPGDHTLGLDEGRRLPAGIYMIRIVQGAHSASGRVVLLH